MQSKVRASRKYAFFFYAAGDLTWGRLALPDEEGALRVPGSEEEPHGFVPGDVLEEPPAEQRWGEGGLCVFFFLNSAS